MPNPIDYRFGDASSAPFDMVVPVSKADAPLPDGPCRALVVGPGGAGTVNIKDGSGVTRTSYPLFEGVNAVVCQEVRTGGTASQIWAGY